MLTLASVVLFTAVWVVVALYAAGLTPKTSGSPRRRGPSNRARSAALCDLAYRQAGTSRVWTS